VPIANTKILAEAARKDKRWPREVDNFLFLLWGVVHASLQGR
jgi:hypothetical protein